MKRVLTNELKKYIDKEVKLKGWIDNDRDHGKILFFVLRDRGGFVQVVYKRTDEEKFNEAKKIKPEDVVEFLGIVKKRSERTINKDEENGDIEIRVKDFKIISKAKELPFDKDEEVNIETHLNNLPLTLRKRKYNSIFKIQANLIKSFREALREDDFIEFTAPAIVGGDAEGGAGVFKLDYFKGKNAYLATSPQLYKQMMVGVFERVFTTTKVFRAEKHATTRHLSEYYSMDFEMGFIESFEDIMNQLQKVVKFMMKYVIDNNKKELEILQMDNPLVPDGDFPRITLKQAQDIIKDKTGVDKTNEPDLDPEDERFICNWAKEEFGSDFIFITHYPFSKRPFYTQKDPENPEYTLSFDLLYRGVEISTGGQRVSDFDLLVEQIKEKGLDPEKFEFYLKAFEYGMPPHGGIGMGIERVTAKTVGVKNVKEATLFPRDMTRIDLSISDELD